nr:MAG TPA: hypothetical protein [Bacteriophage sp.]
MPHYFILEKQSGNSDNGSQCRVFIANANNASSNS